jgi:hypothetical protein
LEGRIVVKSKPRQKVHETPSQPIARYNIMSLSSQAIRRLRLGGSRFQASPGKIPYLNGKKVDVEVRLSSQQWWWQA